MQDGAISQRRTHRPVQAVFEVADAFPLHGVREEIAVERGVLREQAIKRQHCRGGDQFVEPDLSRGNPRPVPVGQAVLWVRLAVAHTLEDHPRLVFGAGLPDAAMQDRLSRGPCPACGVRGAVVAGDPRKLVGDRRDDRRWEMPTSAALRCCARSSPTSSPPRSRSARSRWWTGITSASRPRRCATIWPSSRPRATSLNHTPAPVGYRRKRATARSSTGLTTSNHCRPPSGAPSKVFWSPVSTSTTCFVARFGYWPN